MKDAFSDTEEMGEEENNMEDEWAEQKREGCQNKYIEECSPLLVNHVFVYFKERWEGMIKALTTDSKSFLDESDSDSSGNLSLYAGNDGQWRVRPSKSHFVEPEPKTGINFARKGFVEEKDWLLYVARHSDSWLISVAFYYASILGFDANDRKIPRSFDK